MGGLDEAFKLKNELRKQFNLPVITENPSIILNQMPPATPPPNPVDIVNELQFTNPNSSYKRKKVTTEINFDFFQNVVKNSVFLFAKNKYKFVF